MQPIYPPPYRFAAPPQPRIVSTGAVLSLVFGILSLLCAGFLSGIPAVVLALVARKRIAASGGEVGGGGLAIGGLVTGLVGSILSLFVVGLIALGALLGDALPQKDLPNASADVVGAGRFEQVVLHPTGGTLEAQLRREATVARGIGQRPSVLLHAEWCTPCKQIERDLDRSGGRGLDGVRLIKLDVDEWEDQLEPVGLGSNGIPAVYRLGPDGHALGRPHVGSGFDELRAFVSAE